MPRFLEVASTTTLGESFDPDISQAIDKFVSAQGWSVGQVAAALCNCIALSCSQDADPRIRSEQMDEALTLTYDIWAAIFVADFPEAKGH